MVHINMLSSSTAALLVFAATASQALYTGSQYNTGVHQRSLLHQRDLLEDDLSNFAARNYVRDLIDSALEARSISDDDDTWSGSRLYRRVSSSKSSSSKPPPARSNTSPAIPMKNIPKAPTQKTSTAPPPPPKAVGRQGSTSASASARQKPALPKLDTSVGGANRPASQGIRVRPTLPKINTNVGNGPRISQGTPAAPKTGTKPTLPRLDTSVGHGGGGSSSVGAQNAPRPQTPPGSPPRRNSGLASAGGSQRPTTPTAVSPTSPNNGNNNWWKKVGDQMAQKPLDTAIKVGNAVAGYGAVGAAGGALYSVASNHGTTAAIGAGAATIGAGAMAATGGLFNTLNTAKNDQQAIRDKDRDKGKNPGQAGSKFGASSVGSRLSSAGSSIRGWFGGNSQTRPTDGENMVRRRGLGSGAGGDDDVDMLYQILAARGVFDAEDDFDDSFVWDY